MDWSSLDLSALLTEFKAVLPVVVPTVISFMAIRKGWNFLRSQVKGA